MIKKRFQTNNREEIATFAFWHLAAAGEGSGGKQISKEHGAALCPQAQSTQSKELKKPLFSPIRSDICNII